MAISIVQQKAASAYAQSVSCSPAATVAGNAVILRVLHQSTGNLLVTDSAGQTYTYAGDIADAAQASGQTSYDQYKVAIYYKLGSASITSVTVSSDQAANKAIGVSVLEASGVQGFGSIGSKFYNTNQNNFTTTPAGPALSTVAGDLVVAACSFYNSASGATVASPLTIQDPLGVSTVQEANAAGLATASTTTPAFTLPSGAANGVGVVAATFLSTPPAPAELDGIYVDAAGNKIPVWVRYYDGTTLVALNPNSPLIANQNVVVTPPSGAGYTPATDVQKSTISAVPSGNQMTFAQGTYQFSDFTMFGAAYSSNGHVYNSGAAPAPSGGYGLGLYFTQNVMGARGSGIDRTIFSMVPGSSTRADQIPPDENPPNGNYLYSGTNNLSYVRLGNNNGAVYLTDVTIQGTDQGHNYNGLLIVQAPNSQVTNVKVTGIPGSGGANPAETFPFNINQSGGTNLTSCEMDGRRGTTLVAATGFGINNSDGVTMTDCYSHHTGFGAGVSYYQCSNITSTRFKADNIHTGSPCMNFERVGGTNEIVAPNLTRGSTPYHVMIESDTVSGTFNFRDPVYDGTKFIVKAGGTYQGNPNAQDTSAIHLFVNGTERPDLLSIILNG